MPAFQPGGKSVCLAFRKKVGRSQILLAKGQYVSVTWLATLAEWSHRVYTVIYLNKYDFKYAHTDTHTRKRDFLEDRSIQAGK